MIIPVKTENGGYDIILERGALSRAGEYLSLGRRVLIVTDDGVPAEYAAQVQAQCGKALTVTLPQGEATKCFDSYQRLLRTMAENGFSRGDCVVAVGGGVMGDLAGFAAATYMRGIDFYNVPTTMLSMVDSSIGGKVAIDMDGIKNIVGAFYQPGRVLIDPQVLSTLCRRQYNAGLAEAVKMAATSDEKLFELIESDDPEKHTDEIIERSLLIKKSVVEQDPTEKGLRRVLNFGHTVGHAIESNGHGKYIHGECVALGMLTMCSDETASRLRAVLGKVGLPTKISVSAKELIPYLKHDKKLLKDKIVTVYVKAIGSFEFRQESIDEIEKRIALIEN
ncbi:MAG: 3-dehydroquinate synthase [Acutalibacteraceae bacterium]|nr:3-dehydroquinate synthase [Oscillospiraceae bacterium]